MQKYSSIHKIRFRENSKHSTDKSETNPRAELDSDLVRGVTIMSERNESAPCPDLVSTETDPSGYWLLTHTEYLGSPKSLQTRIRQDLRGGKAAWDSGGLL